MNWNPRFKLALIAVAVLSGCSTATTTAPIQNLPTAPVVTEKVQTPIAVAVPVPLSDRLTVNTAPQQRSPALSVSKQPSARIQELLDEASRLGRNGDYQGQLDVLVQAGYYGSGQAFYEAARMHSSGPLPTDADEVARLINLAHEAGYVEATRVLGMLYLRGQGVPKDLHYGRLLLDAASKESPRAAREYGLLLLNRAQPHLNDWDLGIAKLREASLLGDYDASVILATEFENAGLLEDATAARQVANETPKPVAPARNPNEDLRRAAMAGDTDAMFRYAQNLLLRKAPSQQPDLDAYCWLSVASDLGHSGAKFELGLLGGIKASMKNNQLERLNQCISELHSMSKSPLR